MTMIEGVGETTITGKNQINLPAQSIRQTGWVKGDRLLVEVVNGDMIVLLRRPESWTDAFAGRMGHVFGTQEETLRYLAEERRDWDEWARERGV